jgi:polar amino acid transport system substrate-binding protein
MRLGMLKVKFFIRMILVLLSLLLVTSPLCASEIVLLDANESPPYWSANLEQGGMFGELIHSISSEAGIISKIKFRPLSRLIEDESNNDLGDPVFYMRNQEFSAIIPIAIQQSSLWFYSPKQVTKQENIQLHSLKGKRIGVLKGTISNRDYFNELNVRFEESFSHASLFKKLRLGRLDMVLELDLVGKQAINILYPNDKMSFQSISIKRTIAPIAILLDIEHPNGIEIGKKYLQGLNVIIKSGRYHMILERYFGKGNIPPGWFKALDHFHQLYNDELNR